MARRVAVRVCGVASTAKGFAYAVTEGPQRLVGWGLSRADSRRIPAELGRLLRRMRPLFVSFDRRAAGMKRIRGRLFSVLLLRACGAEGIMILSCEARHATSDGRRRVKVSKWQIASDLASRFREIAHKLPEKRLPWQAEDDRMGIFMALAASVAAWRNFAEGYPAT